MFGLGWPEVMAIGGVALLLLGPGKIPELARGLGKGIFEFKRGLQRAHDDDARSTTKIDSSKT